MGTRLRIKLLTAIICLCVAGKWQSTLRAQQDKPGQTEPSASSRPRSVLDGVYTEEQAKRGELLYRQKCALCHGDRLTGGESAPPLAGGQFLSNWNGLTLDYLFERIRVTMPNDNPARVSRVAKADILAYILSMNRYPPGKADLQYKSELLKDILIEPGKPGKTGARAQRGQR